MHSARSQESPLSQDQTIFGRHAGRLLGLVALVGAVALGTLPVSAQTVMPETPLLPAVTALGPRELVKSSLSRVLTIVESGQSHRGRGTARRDSPSGGRDVRLRRHVPPDSRATLEG